jgi:hypothetical protein
LCKFKKNSIAELKQSQPRLHRVNQGYTESTKVTQSLTNFSSIRFKNTHKETTTVSHQQLQSLQLLPLIEKKQQQQQLSKAKQQSKGSIRIWNFSSIKRKREQQVYN